MEGEGRYKLEIVGVEYPLGMRKGDIPQKDEYGKPLVMYGNNMPPTCFVLRLSNEERATYKSEQ